MVATSVSSDCRNNFLDSHQDRQPIEQLKLSIWEKICHFFRPKSDLYQTIQLLAQDTTCTERLFDCKKVVVLAAFQSSEYNNLQPYLAKIFEYLKPEQLHEFLNQLFDKHVEEDANLSHLIQQISQLISLNKIESAIKTHFPHFQTAKDSAFDVAKIVNSQIEIENDRKFTTLSHTIKLYCINAIEWVIDLFIMASQITRLGQDTEDTFEAMFQMDIFFNMGKDILIFLAALQVVTGSWLITITGLAIAATLCFIYFKFFKPCPDQIPPCVNLTSEAKKGKLEAVLGREEEIEQLILALGSNVTGSRSHPMLVGPSGVGKTEIVKGLAQRIVAGKVPSYLKNKKVFYINTSELIRKLGKGKEDVLERILKKVHPHEKDAIFFFDEIHLVYTGRKKEDDEPNILGERLKTLLDSGSNNIHYCIGATTSEEYNKYLSGHWAFERRFEKITIKNTDEKQTLSILSDMLSKEAIDITNVDTDKDSENLKLIYTLTKEQLPQFSQPSIAKKILAKCISKIRSTQQATLIQQLHVLKSKKEQVTQQYLRQSDISLDTPHGLKTKHCLNELETQILEKEKEINAAKKGLELLNKLKKQNQDLKKHLFKQANQIQKGASDLLTNYALSLKYLKSALQKAMVKAKDSIVDAKTEIDRELILEMIMEEKTSRAT